MVTPRILPDLLFQAINLQKTFYTNKHFTLTPGELVQDAFAKPYKVEHFTLTQSFLFNDPATMTTSDEQPIPGAVGPYQITNAVVADPGSPSGFSFVVTKDSVPSDPINLP